MMTLGHNTLVPADRIFMRVGRDWAGGPDGKLRIVFCQTGERDHSLGFYDWPDGVTATTLCRHGTRSPGQYVNWVFMEGETCERSVESWPIKAADFETRWAEAGEWVNGELVFEEDE